MTPSACPAFILLLERFVDGECDAGDSLRIREHLGDCSACRISMRSMTELNRRVAQSPAPPVPPDLEQRLRAVLRNEGAPRRARRWIPAAAAAAGIVVAVFLFRPSPAGAEIPSWVAATAAVHDAFLSGATRLESDDSIEALRAYFEKTLKVEVAAPAIQEGSCVGGCPCAIGQEEAPWILYRRGGTPISLILVDEGVTPLPTDSSRTLKGGRRYHVFQVGRNTVLVCRTGSGAHVWIARLPEAELVSCALETVEGRDAFTGDALAIRDVVCRACCARVESAAKKIDGVTDVKVKLESMEVLISGKKRLDLDRVIRDLRGAGIDVRSK